MPSFPTSFRDQKGSVLPVVRGQFAVAPDTSQLPIDNWHAHIGNSTIADAVLDRLVHNAHRLELKGESLRKLRTAKNARLDAG
jgi:IstB-like ATP binding protein